MTAAEVAPAAGEDIRRYFRLDTGDLTPNNLGTAAALLAAGAAPTPGPKAAACAPGPAVDALARHVATPSSLCFLNDVPVGLALCTRSERDTRMLLLRWLGVLPAYRGIGVARFLLEALAAGPHEWLGVREADLLLPAAAGAAAADGAGPLGFLEAVLGSGWKRSEKEEGLLVWELRQQQPADVAV